MRYLSRDNLVDHLLEEVEGDKCTEKDQRGSQRFMDSGGFAKASVWMPFHTLAQ